MFDLPSLQVKTDRTKVQEVGFTQRDVASSLLIALSGSFQTAPSFYLNPANGVSYQVASQVPQYHLDSLQTLAGIPVTGPSGAGQARTASRPGRSPGTPTRPERPASPPRRRTGPAPAPDAPSTPAHTPEIGRAHV